MNFFCIKEQVDEVQCELKERSVFRLGGLAGELVDGWERVSTLWQMFDRRNANRESARTGADIDVLIATDTIAAGVNLQDATLVVHYDVPWTADVFNQRNGRIMRFRAQPTEVRSVLFTAIENLEKLRTLESRLESAAMFSDINRVETFLDQNEVEGEVLRAAAGQRSSDVLADFAVLGRHQELARGLRNGLVTARYESGTDITTVSVVRINGVADALGLQQTHGGKNDKVRTISDTEALQAFRCPEHEEIAAVAFTIDGLIKWTINEFVGGGPYPADSVHHVASVALIPHHFPGHLTPTTRSKNP